MNFRKQATVVLNRAIHKITSNLPKRINGLLNQKQISQIDETQPHKEKLYEAIRERRIVSMRYNSFGSRKEVRHRLAPYAVLFRKHSWYVIGRSEGFKQVLTFRIDRINALSLTYTHYEIPENFFVQRYMEKSWNVMLGPETHVVILFSGRIAPLIREVKWHSTQQMQQTARGKLRFEVTVAGWQEIGWWVLSWGDEAKVIKPRELQEWVAQTAKEMHESKVGFRM